MKMLQAQALNNSLGRLEYQLKGHRIDALIARAEKASTWTDKKARFAKADEIALKLTPLIKRMLMRNLKRFVKPSRESQKRSSHQNLREKAIRDVIVAARTGDVKNMALRIQLPPNMRPYEQKGKNGKINKSDFYTVAASLQYGAVRMPKREVYYHDKKSGIIASERRSLLGAPGKRTLKAKALTGKKFSDRQIGAIEKHGWGRDAFKVGQFHQRAKSSKMSGGTADVVVIKPQPWFFLTPSDIKLIQAAFHQELADAQ
jgi:hypothetical protein